MKEIQLTQGKTAIVDDSDYERENQYKWFAYKDKNTFYAKRNVSVNGKQRCLFLHGSILGKKENLKIDHQDGNGLNCQIIQDMLQKETFVCKILIFSSYIKITDIIIFDFSNFNDPLSPPSWYLLCYMTSW